MNGFKYLIVILFAVGLRGAYADGAVEAHKTSITGDTKTINEVIRAAATCTHWGGEVGDQTPDRNKQIEAGVAHDCLLAEKLVTAALVRFPNDLRIIEAALQMHDAGHMELSDRDIQRLCAKVSSGAGCQ